MQPHSARAVCYVLELRGSLRFAWAIIGRAAWGRGLAEPGQRPALADRLVVATTAWVAEEAGSNLALLLERIGARWQVRPRLEVAALRFHGCSSAALRDYERGYVKEGVGAGGLALLWQLAGRQPGALAEACDAACRLELGA